MGKNLNNREIGKGLSQRKDGRYSARFVTKTGERREWILTFMLRTNQNFLQYSSLNPRETSNWRKIYHLEKNGVKWRKLSEKNGVKMA